MSESVFSKVVTAALGTAVAALIALGAVEHLDRAQTRAASWFAGAVAFFAACLVLRFASSLSSATRSAPERLRWLCFIAGGTCWLQGSTSLLARFHTLSWLPTALLAIFALAVTYAAVEASREK
ncbi:hypothetical protein [Paraburkholderia graminis]|uniref:hypothetical protein n=1 Tax=Paraburkholderia graminis TaxID=60548 RepID=UPI0038BA350D